MVGHQLELTFAVRDRNGHMLPPEELHSQGEQLMVALLDLEKCNDVRDSATSSDTATGKVTVDLFVAVETSAEAAQIALTVCRTAIHAIGGSTPDWSPAAPDAAPPVDFRPTGVLFDYA